MHVADLAYHLFLFLWCDVVAEQHLVLVTATLTDVMLWPGSAGIIPCFVARPGAHQRYFATRSDGLALVAMPSLISSKQLFLACSHLTATWQDSMQEDKFFGRITSSLHQWLLLLLSLIKFNFMLVEFVR